MLTSGQRRTEGDDVSLELIAGFHETEELRQVVRFADEAVAVELVDGRHVARVFRARSDDDRNVLQMRRRFNGFQDVKPADFGQRKVEKDQVRGRNIRVLAFLANVGQCPVRRRPTGIRW